MSSAAVMDECPGVLLRKLGELLAPETKQKVRYPMIRRAVEKHLPAEMEITDRRIRSIHQNEARKVCWRERDAIRQALANEEAKRELREFEAATNRLVAALAEAGTPLSGAQEKTISRILVERDDPTSEAAPRRRWSDGGKGRGNPNGSNGLHSSHRPGHFAGRI